MWLSNNILIFKIIADDNEWKVRFESQTALNKQFQEQKDWLETELVDARRKLTTGKIPNLKKMGRKEIIGLNGIMSFLQ